MPVASYLDLANAVLMPPRSTQRSNPIRSRILLTALASSHASSHPTSSMARNSRSVGTNSSADRSASDHALSVAASWSVIQGCPSRGGRGRRVSTVVPHVYATDTIGPEPPWSGYGKRSHIRTFRPTCHGHARSKHGIDRRNWRCHAQQHFVRALSPRADNRDRGAPVAPGPPATT